MNDLKSKGIRMPYCLGCRPRNKNCAFMKKFGSRLRKAEVAFSFECPDLPCDRMKTLDTRYKVCYRVSMIDNSGFIKEHGMQKFLEELKQSWKYLNCGELICYNNGVCFSCGLEKLRNKKNFADGMNKQHYMVRMPFLRRFSACA